MRSTPWYGRNSASAACATLACGALLFAACATSDGNPLHRLLPAAKTAGIGRPAPAPPGVPLAAGSAARALTIEFRPSATINIHDLFSHVFSVGITNVGRVPLRFLPWVGILLYDSHRSLLNDFAIYDTRDKLPWITERRLVILNPGVSVYYHCRLEGVSSPVAPSRYLLKARLQNVSEYMSWAPELGSKAFRLKKHIWDKLVDSPPVPVLLYSPTAKKKGDAPIQRLRRRGTH